MDEVESADRAGRKRARMTPALAMMFIAQQAVYLTGSRLDEGKLRLVNYISIGGWLMLSIILLVGLATGGGWLRGARIRELLNDENTRANRAEGFRYGFLATMVAALMLYVASLFTPVDGRAAIHVLVAVGIAAALLRFGLLERRALGDG